MKLHDALRDEWRNVALSANAGNVEALKVLLRERLQSKPMDAMERVFNLKKDAGGILEFRLTGFIEQFLSCRLVQFSADDLELAKAHEFFLVLRDHMYRITRSHVVGRSNIEQTCSAMERELNETLSPDELWNKVIGHRRKVRAGFKSAVDALR